FSRKGVRVEPFADGTRFAKERLWHVEIVFQDEIRGPLVIGDGRFLGLGLMAPLRPESGVAAFRVTSGLTESSSPEEISRALRRAVMARWQVAIGDQNELPRHVSGHDEDGTRAAGGSRIHYLYDPEGRRVLVVESRHALGGGLALAMDGFEELRAGKSGRLALAREEIDSRSDPLFAQARSWRTLTRYDANRHEKAVDASAAIAIDVRASCKSARLPVPTQIRVFQIRARSGSGLSAHIEVSFPKPVGGPLLLGRSRFHGGGLFTALRGRKD
ncbi:MAG: hypothetical protein JKY87_06005, partial [Mariprofundus sp.]|nr:hypothetical protein [Mariprofundus sp.]